MKRLAFLHLSFFFPRSPIPLISLAVSHQSVLKTSSRRRFSTQNTSASENAANESKEEAKEKAFDYSKMDLYQILEVFPNATDIEMKKSYLKLAKKYHPDVYREGPNKDHFKKVAEAYNTLKNPLKRSDYDKHQRIKSMKSSADFADFEQRHKHSKDFSHEMYQEMKQNAQKSKTIREEMDPEIEEAFKKLNMNKMYREFMTRPMFSSPEELHD